MKLRDLIAAAGLNPVRTAGDGEIGAITIDSRAARPGALFVCMPGMNRESQGFLPNAAQNGAAAAVVRDYSAFKSARSLGLAAVQVTDEGHAFAEAAWRLCDAFFDHPTRRMKVVGVTGTNGKTTTAWLIRDMLATLGVRAAYLGTLGFHLPGESRDLPNTTPFAVDLYNLLAEARDKGVDALAVEVSSHALAQRRIDGVEFDAAVFTNLTQDHLDFHGTMSDYAAAKRRLFDELPRQSAKRFVAAINQDDPTGRDWTDTLPEPLVRFSLREEADVWPVKVEVGLSRIEMEVRFWDDLGPSHVRVALGGHYNAENLVAAFGGMLALGFAPEDIVRASSGIRPVPGRFEAVPNETGVQVLVDYAHTSDAIGKLLDAVRPLTSGQVITVFGCGGDRDRTKRPLMARAASERSDLTIVTSDNPRTEDPQEILNEVATGILPGRPSRLIIDRPEAIREAIRLANPGDAVVIAGKGHETYQIIGHQKLPMDDRTLARESLSRRERRQA